MRPYQDRDRPALERFLRGHVETSMFPLGNLAGGGLPTESWLADGPEGMAGYLGLAANGNLLPQWPGADWSRARTVLEGRSVAGLVGPADQVSALCDALGLAGCRVVKSEVQPGLSLSLDTLRLPDCAGLTLRRVGSEDRALLTGWRKAYNAELSLVTPDKADELAEAEVARTITGATAWILWRDGLPVSLSGYNARIPGVVQLGGIYTPPEHRGRGYAGAAIALMLTELRGEAIDRALLFAASDRAVRAYQALGFAPSHSFAVHLLAQAQTVLPCP